MTLNEMIYKRQSCRSFSNAPLSEDLLNDIEDFGDRLKPLNENIKTEFVIVDHKDIKSITGWKAPHYIAIFSERKPGFGVNVGFMFQQMDLYLQSKGLGCCWLGMAMLSPRSKKDFEFLAYDPDKAEIEEMPFVILLGFGRTNKCRQRNPKDFQRKIMSQIADTYDDRLEPARLAPSARNKQPWFFTHEGKSINIYFNKQRAPGKLNQIDIGIALAHMYISNTDSFKFYLEENPKEIKGLHYMGSFTI
ncbi:MAG TPA: nitroreductase family protein [Anaerovoracaceae bacterium]|nr:nitroreductase family protein [Anaerovoracaceae bacterium]